MIARQKLIAGAVVLAFVGTLVVITAIDMHQQRAMGQSLDAPAKIYSLPADAAASISELRLHNFKGNRLLTGKMSLRGESLAYQDATSDAEEQSPPSPPGEVLDLQVPKRAERLRESALRNDTTNALKMHSMGHSDLAARMLGAAWARQPTRQFIGELTDDDHIRINASIEGSALDIMASPSGHTLMFDTGEHDRSDSSDNTPFLYQGFLREGAQASWRFVPDVRVPHSFQPGGMFSEEGVYSLEDNDSLWARSSPSHGWHRVKLAAAVWGFKEDDEGAPSLVWILLPGPSDEPARLRGWSRRFTRDLTDGDRYSKLGADDLRSFEVDLSGALPVVGKVIAVENGPDFLDAPTYRMKHAPDGGVLWLTDGTLRYLPNKANQWSEALKIPHINGQHAWIDDFWVDDDIWIADARAQTLWNRAACFMPPFFRNTRNCGGVSAQAFFYSTDKGKSWTPFALPSTLEKYSYKVLGWDAARKHMLVAARNYGRGDEVQAYRLPESNPIPAR